MTCFRPREAWRSKDVNPSGRRPLVFDWKRALDPDDPMKIACRQCIGCRLCRSAQWGARASHEAQLYTKDGISDNSFITLTFEDKYMFARDSPWSLDVADWQKFAKRLRKSLGKKKIRTYHCGEYGECCRVCGVKESDHKSSGCEEYQLGRPHYHALIFGHRFDDRFLVGRRNGFNYYSSPSLQACWPFGFVVIGDLTFATAAYVARYCLKKRNGAVKLDRYRDYIDRDTGEIFFRKPEYATMSNRDGIGKRWFDQYWRDVYPHDYVQCGEFKIKVPEYYDKLLERKDPFFYDEIKQARLARAAELDYTELSHERLWAREQVKLAQISQLVRE